MLQAKKRLIALTGVWKCFVAMAIMFTLMLYSFGSNHNYLVHLQEQRQAREQATDGYAVIAEPRNDRRLEDTVLHFTEKLPNWGMRMYHTENNKKTALVLKEKVPRLELQLAPTLLHKQQRGGGSYSRLMTSYDFWLNIPHEHILVFQTDARICDHSDNPLSYFLNFSMIGAGVGAHGCGGLSLRRRSVMLALTDPQQGFQPTGDSEDVQFEKRFFQPNINNLGTHPTQTDRDFFSTEGSSDGRLKRPELGQGGQIRPWSCHKLGCIQYDCTTVMPDFSTSGLA